VPIAPVIGFREIVHHVNAVYDILIGPQGQSCHSNGKLQAEFI